MRPVNIDDFEGQLDGYHQQVKDGEEIVLRDENGPIARIVPIQSVPQCENEARLVAPGALKVPDEKIDWDEFFRIPVGNVSHETAVRAAIEGRGDR